MVFPALFSHVTYPRIMVWKAHRDGMNDDQTFLNIIDFGYTQTQLESPIGEQPTPSTQHQATPITEKAKSNKGKNWSSEEDNILIAAWGNTSLDSVGTDQNRDTYWARISEYYNSHKMSSWPERNANAINCRYTLIKKETARFCGCLQQILNMKESGRTIEEKTNGAHIMFKEMDLKKKKPFTLMHCYVELSKYPKWQTKELETSRKKQKKTVGASPGTSTNDLADASSVRTDATSIHRDALEHEQRPDGVKKDKLRKVQCRSTLRPLVRPMSTLSAAPSTVPDQYMLQLQRFLADARATNIISPDRTPRETLVKYYGKYDRLSAVLRKDSVPRFLRIFENYRESFVSDFVIIPQTLDLIILHNALRCANLVLEGKSPKLCEIPAESFSAEMVESLFRYGASANQRTSGNKIIQGLLPLHVAIENTCQHKYLEDNLLVDEDYRKGNVEYIYKLIYLLCLPEMKIFLDTTRSLAAHTDNVVDELWNYIKQGKLVPTAILLLAAQNHCGNLNVFDIIKARIEDSMCGLGSSKNAKEKKELKEMKVHLINALVLVRIIHKTGEALEAYIQTHSEASHEEVLGKVSAVLQNYSGKEICIEDLDCPPYDCGGPDGDTYLTKAAIGSPTLEVKNKRTLSQIMGFRDRLDLRFDLLNRIGRQKSAVLILFGRQTRLPRFTGKNPRNNIGILQSTTMLQPVSLEAYLADAKFASNQTENMLESETHPERCLNTVGDTSERELGAGDGIATMDDVGDQEELTTVHGIAPPLGAASADSTPAPLHFQPAENEMMDAGACRGGALRVLHPAADGRVDDVAQTTTEVDSQVHMGAHVPEPAGGEMGATLGEANGVASLNTNGLTGITRHAMEEGADVSRTTAEISA
ncbi:hypothetical protein ZWY2020_054576 [Hordeum vulgare]|nr:hypothetical protein ZWY2020_054576 [Hordeum vulgare]